jgi:hypothetical protein
MVDYRKFDGIDTDSEDEEPKITPSSVSMGANPANPGGMGGANQGGTKEIMTKKGKEGRIQFQHEGRVIYEWEQSLSEVNIYVGQSEICQCGSKHAM